MLKNSATRFFRANLNSNIKKITNTAIPAHIELVLDRNFDFKTDVCVKIHQNFKEKFGLQNQDTIEDIFEELKIVSRDEPFIDSLVFISNTVFVKMKKEFWKQFLCEERITKGVLDDLGATVYVDLVRNESEIDQKFCDLLYDFLELGDRGELLDLNKEVAFVSGIGNEDADYWARRIVRENRKILDKMEIREKMEDYGRLKKKGLILWALIYDKLSTESRLESEQYKILDNFEEW